MDYSTQPDPAKVEDPEPVEVSSQTPAMAEEDSPPRVVMPSSRQPMQASTAERIGQLRGITPALGTTSEETPSSRKKWTPNKTTWPYLEFHQIHKGYPITFNVGPDEIRFDVHNRILSNESPIFMNRHGNAKHITKTLRLPNIQPDDFHLLMNWVYQERPPDFSTAEGLPVLMRLWVTCGALGIWKKQNTLLRLAMALMQPAHFEVDIETVIYVYCNTPPSSKLRKFIIAIFCQRSKIQPQSFSPLTSGLGIWKDVTEFQKVLNEVRKVSPVGIEGYDLFQAFFDREPIDWSRVRHPLPDFLIFDKNSEPLPDDFFVTPVESAKDAVEIRQQTEGEHTRRFSDMV